MEDWCKKLKELIEMRKKDDGPKKLTVEDMQKCDEQNEELKQEYMKISWDLKEKDKLYNERMVWLSHEVA